MLHQSQEAEENLYRQCLADKFPNIKQDDYVICTNHVYAQKVEMLSTHLADTPRTSSWASTSDYTSIFLRLII